MSDAPPTLTPSACPACRRALRVTDGVWPEPLARVVCPIPTCRAEHYARITTWEVSLLDDAAAERAMQERLGAQPRWEEGSRLMNVLGTIVTLGIVAGLGSIVVALLFGLLDALALVLEHAMPVRPIAVVVGLVAGIALLAFFVRVHQLMARRYLRSQVRRAPRIALPWEPIPDEHEGYRG